MARRPFIFFRFSGLLTILLLALGALAYAFVVPKPTPRLPGEPSDGQDERWAEIKAWVKAHPGTAVVVCPWPVDLPRGGRIDLEPADGPGFWAEGNLVQATLAQHRGGLVRASDGQPRAWVSWADQRCDVLRPQTVRIEGQVTDGGGQPRPQVEVSGCGTRATSDESGAFSMVLQSDALERATQAADGPACALTAGGPPTPVPLGEGGVRRVIVR